MYTTRTVGALALALGLVACSDAPTSSVAAPDDATISKIAAPAPATAARKARPAPSTMLVNSPLTDVAGNVVGSFTGTATLAKVAVEGQTLVGSLLLNGTAIVNGTLVNVVDAVGTGTIASGGDATTAAAGPGTLATGCSILDLAIGQIHLNLLGLDVTLSAIDLDIVAVPGAGNLLGNLLCAVVNLLNGVGGGGGGGALGTALTNLLNTVNALLGGLL